MRSQFRCLIPLCHLAALVLWSLLLFSPPAVSGQSAFDAEDTFDPDPEQILIPDQALSPDQILSREQAVPSPGRPPGASPSLLDRLAEDSTLTLGLETAHGIGDGSGLITHAAYLRHQLSTLFLDNLFLEFDGKLRICAGNDHRADARHEDLLLHTDLRQLYLQAGFDKFSLKAGWQILVWGKADTFAVTDVVSPRDRSEFIFPDLEDARFGQPMVSADIYSGRTSLNLFVSPAPLTDRQPDDFTRYFRVPYDPFNTVLLEDRPEAGDVEAGLRISRRFGDLDLSLMAGRFLSNSPVYATGPDTTGGKPTIDAAWPGFLMAGTAGSLALDSVLLKWEGAFKHRAAVQGTDAAGRLTAARPDLADLSAGFEFNANDRYTISFELSDRHLFSDEDPLVYTDRDNLSSYTSFSKKFLNDTLTFEYLHYLNIRTRNMYHGARLSYDVTDTVKVKTAVTFFNIRETGAPLGSYEDEDRISFEIQWSPKI